MKKVKEFVKNHIIEIAICGGSFALGIFLGDRFGVWKSATELSNFANSLKPGTVIKLSVANPIFPSKSTNSNFIIVDQHLARKVFEYAKANSIK